MKFVFPLFIFIGMTTSVLAHQAESGWTYPPECCGQSDCNEAVPGEKNGQMTLITPRHGEREIPSTFQSYRPSPDGKWHLCAPLEGTHIYCIFSPEGT